MKRIAELLTGPGISRILNFIIYILFIYFSYGFFMDAETTEMRIFVVVITLLALVIVIYYEYLKYINQSAIKALNYDCDPEKCLEYLNRLEELDKFNGFKNNRIVFNSVYYLATYQPEKCLELIKDNDKLFRNGIDALLIRNASIFLSYVEMNNKSQAKKAFPDLIQLKGAKSKGRRLAVLYSWEELEALYMMMQNDSKNACRSFAKVNTQYMNNREKTQYLYYYAKALKNQGKDNEAMAKLNELKEIANKLPVKDMAI